MRKSERDKRTYLIIGLCAVVAVMAIGFAAFAQRLQINSTSEVTSTWDVEITGITRFASSSGVSDATGSPSYDNSNGLTASFSTYLTSPGDYATYKIKIENLGSLNAVLSDITLTSDSSNDITYYVNKNQNNSDITDTDRLIDEGDILNPTGDTNDLDEGYVYVTVKYNDYEGQTSPTGDNKTVSATVKLDFVQSNSSASSGDSGPGGGGGSSNVINGRTIDQTFVPQYYEYHTGSNVTVGNSADTASWTQDPTTLTGRSYYLGHDVEGGNVTANYACFVISDTQYCMKASSDGSTFNANKGLLGTLKDAGTITCSTFDDFDAICSGGGLGSLYARSYGSASAGASDSVSCGANYNGLSLCLE